MPAGDRPAESGFAAPETRYFRSAYLQDPIVYAQALDEWWSCAPDGATEANPGDIPNAILSQTYEIAKSEACELVRQYRVAAEARQTQARTPRTRRDRLLGFAALVFAFQDLVLMIISAGALAVSSPRDAQNVVQTLVGIVGLLVQMSGFAIIGLAFLGRFKPRDKQIRKGALVLAAGVGCNILAVWLGYAATGPYTPPGILPVFVSTVLLFLWAVPALLVARAYANTGEEDARNRAHARSFYLGTAASWLAWLSLLAAVLYAFLIAMAGLPEDTTLASFVVTTAASLFIYCIGASVAAVAFSRESKALEPRLFADSTGGSPAASIKRDRWLAVAASLYALSQLALVVVAILLFGPELGGADGEGLWQKTDVWLTLLAQFLLFTVGVLALVAFQSSRRTHSAAT